MFGTAGAVVDGADIVALCDANSDRLSETGSRFGISEQFADIDSVLSIPDLDFVDVVTQADAHRDLVERAADAGIHVICQKPFAPTMSDARDMVIACRRAGVRLMVHENFRFQPWYREIKRLLNQEHSRRP